MVQDGLSVVQVGLYFVHTAFLGGILGKLHHNMARFQQLLRFLLLSPLLQRFDPVCFASDESQTLPMLWEGGWERTRLTGPIVYSWLPPPPFPAAGRAKPRGAAGEGGVGARVLSQQQTSVLSQQQPSASACITQHQHSSHGSSSG